MTDKKPVPGAGKRVTTVVLKPGREKPVRNRHPWIFSGAIRRIEGKTRDGDLVHVVDHRQRYLAPGYLDRRSQIVVRRWVHGHFWPCSRVNAVGEESVHNTSSAGSLFQ